MAFGLLAGLGAALSWGILEIASGLASRRVGSALVTAGVVVVSAAWCIGLAVAIGPDGRSSGSAVLASAILGLLGAAAYLTYFTALRIGPISVASGVVGAYGGLTVVLAVWLRGEALAPLQAGGALVATAGVVMIGVAFGDGLRETRLAGPGVALAGVALVLFALMAIATDVAVDGADVIQVLVISRCVTAAAAIVALGALMLTRRGAGRRMSTPPVDRRMDRRVILAILVAGTLDVIGLASFTIGVEAAPTWLVGLASSVAPAVTILVAISFLGERLRPMQWLGLLAVAVGLVAIALP